MSLLAPLSIGDLADRLTILRIKSQRIAEPFKLSYRYRRARDSPARALDFRVALTATPA